MHRATLALAITRGLTHEFGHHAIEVATLGHKVTVTAVR